jgi:sporulation protein YlmC with PRC-barrel domain
MEIPHGRALVSSRDQMAILSPLGESGGMLADPMEDLRGHLLVDDRGKEIGRVDDLLVDRAEERVRLLMVRADGPGGAERRIPIPVDAVSRIGGGEVVVARSRDHVLRAAPYRPDRVDQRYLESVYAHYGFYPYWAPGYVYPRYPAYP